MMSFPSFTKLWIHRHISVFSGIHVSYCFVLWKSNRLNLDCRGGLTVGEVSRLRLSPSESRFTRLLLVTLLWGPPGPCCSSPAGHVDLSAGLRPFQSTALWDEGKEEKGQPLISSAASNPPSPPSPPGLSSPQSEPTELLNDSEEILRDEDMVVVRKRRRRMVMMTVVVLRIMMTMMMLQPVPYHVAGESSDCGVGGWG